MHSLAGIDLVLSMKRQHTACYYGYHYHYHYYYYYYYHCYYYHYYYYYYYYQYNDITHGSSAEAFQPLTTK